MSGVLSGMAMVAIQTGASQACVDMGFRFYLLTDSQERKSLLEVQRGCGRNGRHSNARGYNMTIQI